ncbi:MAG: PEP-CTERM sorting domain-containing protein, partial [Verrucomicrobiota bacterium]
ADGADIILRDSLTGYTTEGLPGLPNHTGAFGGGFFLTPFLIFPTQTLTLQEFRGIGFGSGPQGNLNIAPNFAGFGLELNIWSSEQALLANPGTGDMYSTSLSNVGVFTPFGIGPENGQGGVFSTFQMKLDLSSLNIRLQADQSYLFGIEVNAILADGDWAWSNSSKNNMAPDNVYLNFNGTTDVLPGNLITPGTTGVGGVAIVANVPEPSTIALAAFGAATLAAVRLRRKQR